MSSEKLPEGYRQMDDKSTSIDKMAKHMMTIAWIIGIAIATWMFASLEERQFNPNANPSTSKKNNLIVVELERNKWGHYVTSGIIDNKSVVFLVDTGATDVAIPAALEKVLNLKRGYEFQVVTANGLAKAYKTKINYLQIGQIVLTDVNASILPSMGGEEVLLGMTALKKLEFRQKGSQLILIQTLR